MGYGKMNKEDIEINDEIKRWQEFAMKKKIIKLNPDRKRVESLAKGVLNNQQRQGLKFCPCRLITKDFEKDLKLVCPCNFLLQKTWQKKGECWCSLFVKK
jgi:ferredoxin-thioredoxin reductase catalytic subunit